ncbi:MAG TPA: glutamate-cysteine ligase family protein [Gemmatimonadales bacterium]|nr:glutamate-cysteine ligase family protein [Gemmatimonadales bacterium]
MTGAVRRALAAHLRHHLFEPPAPRSMLAPRRLGAEVEWLVLDAASGRPCPIDSGEGADGVAPATLPMLRRFGARHGWTDQRTPKGALCFAVRGGGMLTFEPGGQLEYASPPARSLSALVERLRGVAVPLRAAAADEGIELLPVGIDPRNPAESVPLQLTCERYRRMAGHFARIGPGGARMMRQTASFQVSLDVTPTPGDAAPEWRLLNALAPWVTAIFANSALYAGENTGHRSFRAHCWRTLDPRRTGLPYAEERAVDAYLDFALGAPAILLPTIRGECQPFGEWLCRAEPNVEDWEAHLTTLFPDVRPRGHLEMRSCDALDPAWYAAPLAFLAGIAYEPRARAAALDVLPAPDLDLLTRAGRFGLHDSTIGSIATDLVAIALDGCAVLGPRFIHPAHLDEARTYFDQYTRRGISPAEDPAEAVATR